MNKPRKLKKSWLNQYQKILYKIKTLETNKKNWEDQRDRITPIPTYFKYYTDDEIKRIPCFTKDDQVKNNMPPVIVHGSASKSAADIIIEILTIEDDIRSEISRLVRAQRLINDAIESLTDTDERNVLYEHYINGVPLIFMEMPYCYRTIKEIHQSGIDNLKIIRSYKKKE